MTQHKVSIHPLPGDEDANTNKSDFVKRVLVRILEGKTPHGNLAQMRV
jgi:hypothetical protein